MLSIEPQIANRLINSSPAMILSTRLEARINLMAVSWVTWLSCNPPLLGMSITPSCFTHHILRQTGDFVLNIPDRELLNLMHQVGTTTGRHIDKMRVFDVATHWGREVKALSLSYAVGTIECEVQDFQKIGDHTFFIALVRYASVEEDRWEDHWKEDAGLIHYLGGDKYQIGGQIVHPNVRTDYQTLRAMQLKREREVGDLFDSSSTRHPKD